MSNDAIAWALDAPLRGAQRLCLYALAARANWSTNNGDDIAFPGVDRLATDTGCDGRTVLAAVKALELAGYIRVMRSPGRGNSYHLQTPVFYWSQERVDRFGTDGAPLGAPGSPAMTGAAMPPLEAPPSAPGKPAPLAPRHPWPDATPGATPPLAPRHPWRQATPPLALDPKPLAPRHPNHKNLKLIVSLESDVATPGATPPPKPKPKHPGDKGANEIDKWLRTNGVRH